MIYRKLIFLIPIYGILLVSNPLYAYATDDKCKFGDEGYCSPGSCYARGVENGKNNDFGDYFKIDPSRDCDADEFFPRYYEGFIDGWIAAGNTREICERFTDQ